MNWLLPAVISALSVSLMLTGLYVSMYSQYRERYFGVWSLGWVLYCIRFTALVAKIEGVGSGLLMYFIIKLSAFCVGYIILWGVYIFASKPMPKWLHAGYAAGVLWIAYGIFGKISFMSLTLPIHTFLGASIMWGGG